MKCEERTTELERYLNILPVGDVPIRGPLEVQKVGWMTGDVPQFSVVEWVNTLRERLADLKEVINDWVKVDKGKMKASYDR